MEWGDILLWLVVVFIIFVDGMQVSIDNPWNIVNDGIRTGFYIHLPTAAGFRDHPQSTSHVRTEETRQGGIGAPYKRDHPSFSSIITNGYDKKEPIDWRYLP